MATKRTSKKSSLTLHELLAALSYWGTSARLILVTFVAVTVFAVALSETSGKLSAVSGEVITLIYVLGSILLLDFGYVMIARTLPLRRVLDVMCLAVADLSLLGLYAMPKIIVTPSALVNPVGIALLLAVLVLALRLLIGLLFTTKRS